MGHSFSTLKRVKSYARNTKTEEGLSNLSFTSIEKDLLTRLKHENMFVDNVIETSLKKERRLDLIYK
jgi:hypothetical protein